MRRCAVVVSAGLAGVLSVSPLAAQRARFGVAVGQSIFGGNRMIVTSGGDSLTGARQSGLHLRGFVDMPLTSSAFSFRGEIFYSRLTSGAQTYTAFGGSRAVKNALTDQTVGITGSFVGTSTRATGIAPYFTLGAGMFVSSLGYNPDPGSPEVTRRFGRIGAGLVVGGGLRIRAGRPTLVLDWRHYQPLYNERGSAFMPLSLGVVF